jgi:hypothetical protein
MSERQNEIMPCWILGSHKSDYDWYYILGRDAVKFGRLSLKFRKFVLSPSAMSKSKGVTKLRSQAQPDPKDGPSTFLLNVAEHPPNYMATHPKYRALDSYSLSYTMSETYTRVRHRQTVM